MYGRTLIHQKTAQVICQGWTCIIIQYHLLLCAIQDALHGSKSRIFTFIYILLIVQEGIEDHKKAITFLQKIYDFVQQG